MRNRDFERELTSWVAKQAGVNSDSLSAFAEARADAGAREYGDDPMDWERSYLLEALEEIADARNYACWWHQRAQTNKDGDERLTEVSQYVNEGFKYLLLAWHYFAQAREMEAADG